MCTQTTVLRSGRCSRHRLHSSHVLRRPQVSFSVIARLLVREQLSRHALQGAPVGPSQQALQRVRSRLWSKHKAQGVDTLTGVRACFEYQPYPQVCTHEMHGWELKSGRAGGLGANSSWYGGSSTYPWSSSSCVLLALRPNEPGASTRRARHSTLCLSSST